MTNGVKKYKVRVYNFIERFHDEYEVFALSAEKAKIRTMERIFIETDYDDEEFEILEVKEITDNE